MKRNYVVLAGLALVIWSLIAICWWAGRPGEPATKQPTPPARSQTAETARAIVPEAPRPSAPAAAAEERPVQVDGPRAEVRKEPEPPEHLERQPDPYADAEVIAEETKEDGGTKRTTRIVKSKKDTKYPLVRLEETAVQDKVPAGRRAAVRRKEMVADHIIVKLKPGTKEESLVALNSKFEAKIRRKMRVSDTYLVEIPAKDVQALPRMIAGYRQEARTVAYAEPDYIVHSLEEEVIPNDPQFSQLWGLKNTGQNGGTPGADIGAPAAWAVSKGSRAVKVAVIDTGVDYTHPDLAANIWTNTGEIPGDGIDNDGNGYVDDVRGWNFFADTNEPMDDHFHGTHCAGTIGAVGNNGIGIAGVCWQVSIVPLKFLNSGGSGWTSDAVEAIAYATSLHVDVMSNSWGGGGYSQALYDAIAEANDAGILIILPEI